MKQKKNEKEIVDAHVSTLFFKALRIPDVSAKTVPEFGTSVCLLPILIMAT